MKRKVSKNGSQNVICLCDANTVFSYREPKEKKKKKKKRRGETLGLNEPTFFCP